MAKVITTPGQDLRKIAEIAGGNPDLTLFDPPTNELEVQDVTQAQLDTAFATYDGDQTNIDAATVAAHEVVQKEQAKVNFDSQKVFIAFAKLLMKELNILRTQHGLPDRTFAQLRTAIRNEIDSG